MKSRYINRNKTLKSGFTLIEVLIVVTMLGIMLMATYAPYSHYQKKALLKQGVKEVTQSIYEARNLAVNGLDVGGTNVSVGLYFDAELSKNNLIYFGYPFDPTTPDFRPSAFPISGSVDEIKTKDLPNSIQLEEMEGGKKFLFFFEAITGDGFYYYLNASGNFEKIPDLDVATGNPNNQVDINISYKGATTSTLRSDIIYYTDTYIADY